MNTKRADGAAPGAQTPDLNETEWDAMSQWAEGVAINPSKPGVLRGHDAAAFGRSVLRNARAGRPALDPHNHQPGQHAPVRRVRVDTALNEALTAHVRELAERGVRTTASEVIRTALAAYLDNQADVS